MNNTYNYQKTHRSTSSLNLELQPSSSESINVLMNIRPNTPTTGDSQSFYLEIPKFKERRDLELANQHTATSLDVSMCDQYFNIQNGYMSKPNRIIDHISSDIS